MGHSHKHGASHELHVHSTIDWAQLGHGNRTVAHMAYLCLAVNIVLTVAKGMVGYSWNSTSLLADAVHSASDTISDLATILCLRKAKQVPTARYPLGYGKMETLGSFFISCILLSGSLSVGIHALGQVFERLLPTVYWWEPLHEWLHMIPGAHTHGHSHATDMTDPRAIVFMLLSLATKEMLYQAMHSTAQKARSTMLEASAQHQRCESSASIMSLLAVIGASLGYPWLDSLGGLARAAVNGLEAWRLLVRSLEYLCDRSADPDVLEAIDHALSAAASEAELSETLPSFTWSDLAVVPSGPFLAVFVTFYFDQAVVLAQAVATEKWVSEQLHTVYPEVRKIY
ncbi:hypothetical protein MNAN1_000584 [Malassezia nana]|uniref:Cation efflux protein transmembrane domain-containing protein n=1 Tax=Malassezia nana TaxID=180528 RepID=A0AAF0EMT9_9BASI|nr:hypothetical protein MNAN1_000584 [Malassezia nana]